MAVWVVGAGEAAIAELPMRMVAMMLMMCFMMSLLP
jgi:hypothetical protein